MSTLNNGLKTIEFGSINLRTIFNDNMQKLDISTINFVLYADLPTVFIEGRMYFATDVLKFYYDDGTELLEIIGGMEKGLDADKLTSTVDQDLYYATDTNIIYFNDNGTMIPVTGSADFSAIAEDIISVNHKNVGSLSEYWNKGYFTYLYTDNIISKSSLDLNFSIVNNKHYKFMDSYTATPVADLNRLHTVFSSLYDVTLNSQHNILNSSVSTDIKTGSVTRLSISPTLVSTSEFTQLGDLAPSIKVKKITGTTGAAQGSTDSQLHNLTGSKIISFTLKIEQNTDEGVPGDSQIVGYTTSCYHTSTSFIVKNHDTNSGSILSKPYIIYVTYES